MNPSTTFPRYTSFDPAVPVWCATPHQGGAIHRFFDTNPLSPSGRYLAVLRLPFEDRLPEPGETARVCVIDLQTGADRTVAETCGWEPQLGSNINWGASDDELLFNDVDVQTWTPFAWRLNPHTGDKVRLDGTVYQASPDGQWIASSDMRSMRRTQSGYGVMVPDEHVPRNVGVRDDAGLWITSTRTGQRKLVATLKQFVDAGGDAMEIPDPQKVELYGFHTKWNLQGDRLIYTLRWFPNSGASQYVHMKGVRFAVFTLRPDGTDIRLAVPPRQWDKGGHHINFFPDGQHLSMNLGLGPNNSLRLVRCGLDGSDLRPMLPDLLGSGHPTVHPDGRHILTDTYTNEPMVFGDGTVPLRWIDLETATERCLVRFSTAQPSPNFTLRVDPHPAWDKSWRYVTFNGYVDGARRVFIADMKDVSQVP
ncbi:MAG TPA: hypothetical protein VGN72_06145 [Tepidisphaeraceae bacterium]|jgi:hypothetical protein|nr:hypothetical protein [Tepidisphaeraceae bacterium]